MFLQFMGVSEQNHTFDTNPHTNNLEHDLVPQRTKWAGTHGEWYFFSVRQRVNTHIASCQKILGIPKDLFQKVLWPPEACSLFNV